MTDLSLIYAARAEWKRLVRQARPDFEIYLKTYLEEREE